LYISNDYSARLIGNPVSIESGDHKLSLISGYQATLVVPDEGFAITTSGNIEFTTGSSGSTIYDVIEKDYNNRPAFASRDNGSVIVKADMSTTLTDAAASTTLPSTSSETIYAKLQTLRNNVKYLLNQPDTSVVVFNPTIVFPLAKLGLSASLFGNSVTFTNSSTLSFNVINIKNNVINGRVRWKATGTVASPSGASTSSFIAASDLQKSLFSLVNQIYANTLVTLDVTQYSNMPIGTFIAYTTNPKDTTTGGGTIYSASDGSLIATGSMISNASTVNIDIDVEMPIVVTGAINASGIIEL
jgi:hypothetical protein